MAVRIPDEFKRSSDSDKWIVCYPWGSTPPGAEFYGDLVWNTADYYWEEVCVINTLIGHGADLEAYEKLTKKEKKVFIRLLYKVKAQHELQQYFENREFNEIQKTVNDNIKITAEDIELVIEDFKTKISILLIDSPK